MTHLKNWWQGLDWKIGKVSKSIYRSMIIFIILILIQIISAVNNVIFGREFWAPFAILALQSALVLLTEVYGLVLFIYLKFKKAPLEFWLPPFLNLLGLLIFVGFFVFAAASLQLNLFTTPLFESTLSILTMVSFYGLKIAGLVMAIKIVLVRRKVVF